MEQDDLSKLKELELRQRELANNIQLLQKSCSSIQIEVTKLKSLQLDTDSRVSEVKLEIKETRPSFTSVEQGIDSTPPPLPKFEDSPQPSIEEVNESDHEPLAEEEPIAGPISATNWELKLGQTWLVRIGVLSLLTGLIFLSNYAYQNWIYAASAELKVAFFMAVSLGMTAAGIYFEKRKQELKAYGQVISAGGLAAAYYTIYAAHFAEPLHCISSPIIAGALLTAWAGLMLGYACWKQSKIISSIATSMAFYGTIVNPSGWLSLFSALLLSASGMFLLIRYRWTSVGIVTVCAAYIAHAFWLGFYPSAVTDITRYTYLACYWLIFASATSRFTGKSLAALPARIITGINNSALWFLSVFLLPTFTDRPQLGMISLGVGAFFLVCGQLSQRSIVWPKHLSLVFSYKGIFLITVGIIVEASGYSRFLILALEALALLAAAHRMKQPLLRGASILVYSISLITALTSSVGISEWPSYLGLYVISIAYAGSLRMSQLYDKSSFRPVALLPAMASWFVLYFGVFQSLTSSLAISSLLLCSGVLWGAFLALRKPAYLEDVALLSPLVCGTSACCLIPFIAHTPPALADLSPFILLGFWFTSQTSSQLGQKSLKLSVHKSWKDSQDFSSWIFSALTCCLSLCLIESFTSSETIWLWAGGLLAIGGHVLGKSTERISITAPTQFFHIIAIIAASSTGSAMGWIPLALLCIHMLLADSLWKSTVLARYILAPVAVLSLLAQTSSPEIHFTLLGLVFYSWAFVKKDEVLAISGGVFALFMGTLMGLGNARHPELIDYLPMIATLVVIARPLLSETPVQGLYRFVKSSAMWITLLILFSQASRHVEVSYDGKGIAICWALLAFAIFSLGLFLKKRCYRLVGLLWLAASVLHIITIDVMELNTLARIFSFIILGLTLMALGYLYNRYQDRIKHYL